MLLSGDKLIKGLLHSCGDPKSLITRIASGELFRKFIQYECNPAAEKFITMFSITEPEVIRQMNLDWHINNAKSQNGIGFVALYFYISRNVHEVNSANDVLTDENALKEYEKWMHMKVMRGKIIGVIVHLVSRIPSETSC